MEHVYRNCKKFSSPYPTLIRPSLVIRLDSTFKDIHRNNCSLWVRLFHYYVLEILVIFTTNHVALKQTISHPQSGIISKYSIVQFNCHLKNVTLKINRIHLKINPITVRTNNNTKKLAHHSNRELTLFQ